MSSATPPLSFECDNRPWHARPAHEAIQGMGSSEQGLSAQEAADRLIRQGPNVLPRGKSDGPLVLIWRQINNPLIWVLVASGFVAMLVDPVDGIKNGLVILGVVILNTLIGVIQEFKAGKAIEALSTMVPENVTTLRDGQKVTINATELVPGDVVLLASGDKVPADLRLLSVHSLHIEEASLTGESVPTEKALESVDEKAALGDRKNMAFGGTLVTYGTATAIVVSTGERTELGRISQMLGETNSLETPLTRALGVIGKYITITIMVIAAAMLVIGTLRTMAATEAAFWEALREQVIFAIALAVGAIPEGLPAIVTIALAIGVQRMAARRAVVRKLPAVETLGSTTTICTDKTGTLTRNEMTVQALWTPSAGAYEISGVGYELKGHFTREGTALNGEPEDVVALLTAGALSNDSAVAHDGRQWKITGDPTEAALVVSAGKFGLDVELLRQREKRLDTIPFESENQFMATLNAIDGEPTIHVKGAPEVVLKRSTGIAHQKVLDEVERFAGQGMRVLGFARKRLPAGGSTVEMSDLGGRFRVSWPPGHDRPSAHRGN